MSVVKKWIIGLLALCLLLGGCGKGGSTAAIQAEVPPTPYDPYYADGTLRSLCADATFSSDAIPRPGRLNNLYKQQAQAVYEALDVPAMTLTQLSVPNGAWVRIAFSTAAGEGVETFTLYDNNFVVVDHPTEGEEHCVATPGTYETVLACLSKAQKEHSKYFYYEPEGIREENYHAAGYILYDAAGETADEVATGQEIPVVELVGKGLVRVTVKGVTRLYETATGKDRMWNSTVTDVSKKTIAVAEEDGVAVYNHFDTTPLCRLYVAATQENPRPVQGVDFSEDGKELHLLCRDGADAVYDYTVTVASEAKGSLVRVLGDWQTALTPATEKEEQITAYNILKQLRPKEAELGFKFSGILNGRLMVGGEEYFLCELGHWLTDDNGSVTEYEKVADLMVPVDLSTGYVAEPEENELCWDTDERWF